MQESKGARETLSSHGSTVQLPFTRGARAARRGRSRAAAVHREDPARERRAASGARVRDRGRPCGVRALGPAAAASAGEIPFLPARVVLQDFTGVPGGRRPGRDALGGDAARRRSRPDQPARARRSRDRPFRAGRLLRLDGRVRAPTSSFEYERNRERYVLLRWGQKAFRNFRVVPPGHGHRAPGQPRVPRRGRAASRGGRRGRGVSRHARRHRLAHDDDQRPRRPRLGRRRHRGGGGAARAAALSPRAAGRRLSVSTACSAPGTTATDLVLTVTQTLRKHGVVGKFVEFAGPGLSHLSLADRATISNMSPEYGATARALPGRRRDAAVPARHRPRRGARRPRRALHEGAGPLPHRRDAGAGVLGAPRDRPRHDRAEPRRTEAAAGSHVAERRAEDAARRASQAVRQAAGDAGESGARSTAANGSASSSRPAARW